MNAFFVGIGGMGMSGLAKILHNSGFIVAGSDRNLSGEYCQRLSKMGVKIYPQNGEGPKHFMQENNLAAQDFKIVKSTAVEDNVPDIVTAQALNLQQIMRSDLLADMFNAKKGLAIGGTAGKTTTTGLLAWILKYVGQEPSCAVGGIISGLETNAFCGKGPHFIIEADESDGSIVKYQPHAAVVTNVSRDHKSLEELLSLFTTFLNNTHKDGLRLVCGDDENAPSLVSRCKYPTKTYGFTNGCDFVATNLQLTQQNTSFTFDGHNFSINLPGEHNALNALSAIIVALQAGVSATEIANAIKDFCGMKRRFEKIGTVNGVTVIDDFAHNPVEIAAAINTARQSSTRRFIVYQPHGYGPTTFTRNDLVKVFCSLQNNEFLFLDDIYYGGGTVNKTISSQDIIKEVNSSFSNAWHEPDRQNLIEKISSEVQTGDMVLVMGARDINIICKQILERIPENKNRQAA